MVSLSEIKENKREFVIVLIIFAISIIVGIVVGQNETWFRPAFFSAGFMSGSILTCLVLFSFYRLISFILSFFNKKTSQ